MSNFRSHLAVLALLSVIPLAAVASDPVRIEVAALAKDAANLIGRAVVTHGCLVNTPHGSFIQPCGSDDGRKIVLVSDPDYKGVAAFAELGINFASHVEADFAGVLVESDVNWPKPGKRIFLRLDSLTDSSSYEP